MTARLPLIRVARSRLFIKIFAWFWMAVALMILALTVTLRFFEPEIIGLRWTPQNPDFWLAPYARAAAGAYERGGRQALLRSLGGNELGGSSRRYLFNAAGVELTGQEAPPGVAILAARASAPREVQLKVSLRRSLSAVSVDGPSGARYRFVLETPREAGSLGPLFGSGWLWGISAALLALAALCFWVVRDLTSPVFQVGAAARRIAEGDLSARAVDARLLSRRDEFLDLGRDFDTMAARIESLVNTRQRLLWDISHELRSPLTRLSLALGIARRKAGEEAAPSLDRIEKETEQLNRLIEQLLTLARLTGGAGPLLTDEVDLGEVIREVAGNAEFEAGGMNRKVRLDVEREGIVLGAKTLLGSAIENVVRNALRHTGEGTEVTIRLTADNGNALVSVRDRGPGVPDSTLEHLFDTFYRVPDGRDAKAAGSGLGLAITNQAVLVHGGWVKASNAEGGGLEVRIGLPLKPRG